MIIPLIVAITSAASLILSRLGVGKKDIPLYNYIPILFAYLAIVSFTIALIMERPLSFEIFQSTRSLLFLAAIIASGFIWNIVLHTTLKHETSNSTESILLLSPVFSIIVSWFFNPSEFDLFILIGVIITIAIVVYGFTEKHKIKLDKYLLALLPAVLITSFEYNIVTILLDENTITPALMYTLRTFLLTIVFSIYYRPKLSKTNLSQHKYIFSTSLIASFAMVLSYYAFRDSGIVQTSIVLLITPLLVYKGSSLLLKETITKKQLSSSFVASIVIVITILINNNY